MIIDGQTYYGPDGIPVEVKPLTPNDFYIEPTTSNSVFIGHNTHDLSHVSTTIDLKNYIAANTAKIAFADYANEQKVSRPGRIVPLANRHFIFCLEGLDQWLVKRVELPSYVRGKEGQHHITLIVHLYDDCSGISTRQQVEEKITRNGLNAELKYLNPAGTVVRHLKYEGIEVEKVEYSSLSYEDNGDSSIIMHLSFVKETLLF